MLVKDPQERTQTAEQAWDELEDIAIALRGPRWRRDALLPAATEPAEDYYTVAGAPPPRPSTSEIWGPLEGGGADTSPGPYTPPPGPDGDADEHAAGRAANAGPCRSSSTRRRPRPP